MFLLLRRPSAFTPLLISLFLLALIWTQIARFGVVHQGDEGTAAHLFQILMPVQILIIAFFAAVWFRKQPKAALGVLTLQFGAALAVLATVYLLRL